MNKILIVGHPESGYEDVEALLNACGMAQAMPSRREGFLPRQISETLCKAHNATPLQELGTGKGISQLQAGPVWHGMAMDLMLGNLDQPLWGWADPQSIYLLDYWRELDPSIHFILVYDGPHSALTRVSESDAANLTFDSVGHLVEGWTAYNSALLHFFHRNSSRCLLVQSRQVRASASRYLQQVRARINAPWGEALERLAAPGSEPSEPLGELMSEQPVFDLPQFTASDPALPLFLADALTRHQPVSLRLYEELQASANLPFAEEAQWRESPHAALYAWHAMVALQQQISEEQLRTDAQAQQFDAERAANREALARVERVHGELERDSELLVAQLYQVEEELARLQRTGEETASETSLLRDQRERLEQEYRQAEALARQRQAEVIEARARIEALDQECAQRARSLEVLSSQVREEQVRREAEARRVENLVQQRQDALAEAQAKIYALERETADRARHLEAERKRASELVQQHKSQLEKLQQQLANSEREAAKSVQVLQTNVDRLRAEIASLKESASKQPPANSTLAEDNELLLAQLHSVQEELEHFYLENQALRATMQKASTPRPAESPATAGAVLYGAPDCIRQHLNYQVGVTLVQRSKSLAGWVTMPWALLDVLRRHRQVEPLTSAMKLPPLHMYRDADEAERLKRHLSWRLGSAFLSNASTPAGWLRMPWALRRAIKEFRSEAR